MLPVSVCVSENQNQGKADMHQTKALDEVTTTLLVLQNWVKKCVYCTTAPIRPKEDPLTGCYPLGSGLHYGYLVSS